MDQRDDAVAALEMYRAIQASIPGLDAMYRMVAAMIAGQSNQASHILIVGAGGGREIAELRTRGYAGRITALDPSQRNLEMAKRVAGAERMRGPIRFVHGTVDDLPEHESFDAVTSLLVMHHLPDDGTKLAYLSSLARKLGRGASLFHADASLDDPRAFDGMIPAYLAYAQSVGTSPDAIRLELEAIPKLSLATPERTRALFAQAGLAAPREVFRALWYRCWISEPTTHTR